MLHIHRYRRTNNLGDAIQTIALERLLPDCKYVWRDDGICESEGVYLANGWLGDNRPPVQNANTLFAGVCVANNDANYEWMRASRFAEIGARDPVTVMRCAERGIRTVLAGCATSTFDRYEGPRSGVCAVDADHPGAERFTHQIGDIPWSEQRALAIRMLGIYRTAELVVTNRLHVALPCLAFGTPVIVRDPIRLNDPHSLHRFSILDAMGVGYEKIQTLDVSPWRERYEGLLSRNLGLHPTMARPFAEKFAEELAN
jgi:hypothetical protein